MLSHRHFKQSVFTPGNFLRLLLSALLTFEVSGLKKRLLSRDACFPGAPTFELLFSAPANFKSMVEYLWHTYDLASFCAITLRKGGGSAYFRGSLASVESGAYFREAINFKTLYGRA